MSTYTATDAGGRVIYELPLFDGCEKMRTIDISSVATNGRIRLIDCIALTTHNTLKIWEFDHPPLYEFGDNMEWPKFLYSAISYIWKGNAVNPRDTAANEPSRFLAVKGAEDADPISIEVLRLACLASLNQAGYGRWRMIRRAEYIWLDQLCILQTSKTDKYFQIAHMYRVYKCCAQCLILAGGLQRLVPLDEETAWANRAWTLQECLAPRYPVVLFSWTMGTGRCLGTSAFRLREINSSTGAAVARFADIVLACVEKPVVFNICPINTPLGEFDKTSIISAGTPVDIRIFGKGHADLFALHQTRINFQDYEDSFDPSLTIRNYSMIWRCALMRTSSRPVDMVFSIMGLMGVKIDPKNFHADDRLGATIALASQIINRGGSADWLGMPAKIPPCPQLSTFPQFAQTEVAGHARFLRAGSLCPGRSMDDWVFARPSWDYQDRELWHWERIRGEMDEDGYLHFRRRACAATAVTAVIPSDFPFEWPFLKDTDGQVWRLQQDLDLDIPGGKSRIAVIPLWKFIKPAKVNEFHMAEMALATFPFKFMLVGEHAVEKFYLISYFYVEDTCNEWKWRLQGWKEYDFVLGGPELILKGDTRTTPSSLQQSPP